MQHQKVKSVAKQIQTRGKSLDQTVLQTMETISKIVGSTLGPGGRQVLIERQEHGLPPMVTKDGVTVFRALGFYDSAAHCVMEAARDASVRTAAEAGDGTTTATILAEAIVRLTKEYCEKNTRVSPQRVVRKLEQVFREVIEPEIRKTSIQVDSATPEGQKLLRNVAKVSANGDEPLAEAVMECFRLVGDDGNVTITEINGSSRYEVERIDGFPIASGYEECAGKFYPKFVNDPGIQRCYMEKPKFAVFNGKISDMNTLLPLLDLFGHFWQHEKGTLNLVVVATGFSDSVLGWLATMFAEPRTINVFPLVAPQSPFPNGTLYFLQDVCAITGATLLDPLNRPLENAAYEDLGPGVVYFESHRFRSNIVGHAFEDDLLLRVDELKVQLANAVSDLDAIFLQERIGKLTGGIARLKVIGTSNGELKEKRDRAEDAVCAVRGAIRHGCLPGGGWMLLRLMKLLDSDDAILKEVLIPALFEPVARLLTNAGLRVSGRTFEDYVVDTDGSRILLPIVQTMFNPTHAERMAEFKKNLYKEESSSQFGYSTTGPLVYDALEDKHVDALNGGILDSTPAVLEAIRNSVSIAALLGTLGGTVVFARDIELERKEAVNASEWERAMNTVDEGL